MKANDGTGNNPTRDEWQTPMGLWDKLNKQYKFTFDCCASKENTKIILFSSNFLNKYDVLYTKAWMNPPFSQAYEMFKQFFKSIKSGVAIYRCDNMETKVWQDIILKNATWILIPKGRICYEGMQGKGSRFPSALIGYNVDVPKYVEGTILHISGE